MRSSNSSRNHMSQVLHHTSNLRPAPPAKFKSLLSHTQFNGSIVNQSYSSRKRLHTKPRQNNSQSDLDSSNYGLRRKKRKRKRYTDDCWVSGDFVLDNTDDHSANFPHSPSPSPVLVDSWEPTEHKESSEEEFEYKKARKTKPRTPKPKPKLQIPAVPRLVSQPPKKRRRKLSNPSPGRFARPTVYEDSDPEYLPHLDRSFQQSAPNAGFQRGPYQRRSRRGQVLGHVQDPRSKTKQGSGSKRGREKDPGLSNRKKKTKLNVLSAKPKIPVASPVLDRAIGIRPVMNYEGSLSSPTGGRARRNVERKNYAEPTYCWEPPPLPSHIKQKPKLPPEKVEKLKKKNLIANPPDEKLFQIIHLQDDSTRVRLHQSKLFYKLIHDDLPLTMIFANHDQHVEQLKAKNQGWKLLREQRSFHIPRSEGFAKKFIGILKFKETVVASVLFYPGCHDTKVTIRYFVTLKDYRNTGFGKILAVGIRQYIDHVFPSVHEIELWALNEAARAFWQSVGYNIVGKQKQKMRCQHHTKETPSYVQWAVFNCRKKLVDNKYVEAPASPPKVVTAPPPPPPPPPKPAPIFQQKKPIAEVKPQLRHPHIPTIKLPAPHIPLNIPKPNFTAPSILTKANYNAHFSDRQRSTLQRPRLAPPLVSARSIDQIMKSRYSSLTHHH